MGMGIPDTSVWTGECLELLRDRTASRQVSVAKSTLWSYSPLTKTISSHASQGMSMSPREGSQSLATWYLLGPDLAG